MSYLVLALVVSLLSGLVGFAVGDRREAGAAGLLLGLLLGPIGVLLSLAIDWRSQCGICGGRLDQVSGRLPSICPHCGRGVSDPARDDQREPNLSFAAPSGPELPEDFLRHAEERATQKVVRFYCPNCNASLEAKPGCELVCPSCSFTVYSPREP